MTLSKSVITSSTDRCLFNFVREVDAHYREAKFDLFLLRDVDSRLMHGIPGMDAPNRPPSAHILSNPDYCNDVILPFYVDVFKQALRDSQTTHRIAALATHFAAISDAIEPSEEKVKAELALENTINLACDLVAEGLMESGIVEIVCGNTVERSMSGETFPDLPAGAEVVRTFKHSSKIAALLRTLAKVCRRINRAERWALALELEPGDMFVLNDRRSMHRIARLLDAGRVGPTEEDDIAVLNGKLGFNIDIAHMKIADVTSDDIDLLSKYVVHAHICDTPGLHTRDQPVGYWSPVEMPNSIDYEYLNVLVSLDEHAAERNGLPFSHAIALELEGCNRIKWVLDSLSAMDFQLRRAASFH